MLHNSHFNATQYFIAYFAPQCYLMLPVLPKFNATKTWGQLADDCNTRWNPEGPAEG